MVCQKILCPSFKDSQGNIWFGHKNGGVSKYINKEFKKVHPGHGINSIINSITEDVNNKFGLELKQNFNIDINGNLNSI